MRAIRTLLIGTVGTLCILTGCVKKPKQASPVASAPSTSGQTAKTDSADIFNEFYEDSVVDKAKTIKTFSPHQSKTSAVSTSSPANASGVYTPVFSDNGRYVVQVAAVASRWLADELAIELKEKGYPSYITEVQNPTQTLSGTYYRVRIGGFATRTDAQAFGENVLVPARFSYWVDRKSSESSAPLEPLLNQSAPSYTPPPSTYESAIIPGPGTSPGTYDRTPAPSSTGGWQDTSSKW